MTDSRAVTHVDEGALVSYIERAHHRLVYIAPGVSDRIGDALARKWRELATESVQVILDADPEVCRLGYGTIEGLKRLQEQARHLGTLVAEQPGVRIGVVIADHHTIIFSPTPLLIEAGSDAPERPNAVVLTEPPAAVLRDAGLGPQGIIERCIGLDPIRPGRVEEVEHDLERAPPMRFDLARQVRVFTSHFQFVELELIGCFISRRKVRIPSSLIGLAGKEDIERQFHAQYDLVRKGQLRVTVDDADVTEALLLKERADLKRRFLVDLPGYGSVVLRANKKRFEDAVERLRERVVAYSTGVRDQLEKQIENGRSDLVEALLPTVVRNPPDEYTKTHGPKPGEAFLRARLDEELSRAFGDASTLVSNMSVNLVFKDVAYESLVDAKFIETVRKAMPDVEFLHSEFKATPASEVHS